MRDYNHYRLCVWGGWGGDCSLKTIKPVPKHTIFVCFFYFSKGEVT